MNTFSNILIVLKIIAVNVVILFTPFNIIYCQIGNNGISFSGRIIAIINSRSYYIAQNGSHFVEVGIPSGTNSIFNDTLYLRLFTVREQNELATIELAKNNIMGVHNKNIFSSFEQHNFTANPTATYAMQTHYQSFVPFYNSMEEDTALVEVRRPFSKPTIINLKTGDSLVITTSDWTIPFSSPRYAWSPDSKFLAISKEDSLKNGIEHSVLVVDLISKRLRRYQVGAFEIENIVWNSGSDQLAVLTYESVAARHIANLLLIPLGRPFEEFNYDLRILNIFTGDTFTLPVIHRTRDLFIDLFWN